MSPIPVDVERLVHALPINDYGKGKAKSFQNLLDEITAGEAQIVWLENRPIRLLKIVWLKVQCVNKTLVEDRQEFPDGRIRYRGLEGLSEKIYPYEDPDNAAYRALQEELSLSERDLQTSSIRYLGQELNKKESPSYPGLETHYEIYKYEVNLSANLYKPEYVELQQDGKRTHFVWR